MASSPWEGTELLHPLVIGRQVDRGSWTSYYFRMTQDTPSTSSMPQTGAESARQRWQARYERSRVRHADFTTLSGMEVEPAYGPADRAAEDAYPNFENIGWPGEFPFTRGLYPTGYR